MVVSKALSCDIMVHESHVVIIFMVINRVQASIDPFSETHNGSQLINGRPDPAITPFTVVYELWLLAWQSPLGPLNSSGSADRSQKAMAPLPVASRERVKSMSVRRRPAVSISTVTPLCVTAKHGDYCLPCGGYLSSRHPS